MSKFRAGPPVSGGTPVNNLQGIPRTQQDLCTFTDDVLSYCRNYRQNFEYRLRETVFFLAGDQWVRYLPYLQRFDQHSLDTWVPTPVTNHLVPFYDYLLEVFTAGNPYPNVEPATREPEDVEAAKVARRVMQSEFERLKSETNLILPAAAWLIVAGSCVLSSSWSPDRGRTVRWQEEEEYDEPYIEDGARCSNCGYEEPVSGRERCSQCGGVMLSAKVQPMGEDGAPLMRTSTRTKTGPDGKPLWRSTRIGDVQERVVNLLNWFPQPTGLWKDVRFVVETDPVDVDYVRDVFGSKAAGVTPEALVVDEWTALMAYGANDAPAEADRQRQNNDRVLLRILRHIPDHRFKKGLLVICTKEKVLYSGPLDSPTDALPYSYIPYRLLPGQFWGRSPLQDILPQQKRINGIDSSIILNRKQNVHAQWLVPVGSGITRITGQSGLIIRWNPATTGGHAPVRQPGTPLPGSVNAERNDTLNDMRAIGGISEIMQGRLPEGASGLETGAAVEYVYESAFKRFKAALALWRNGLAEHFHRNLMLCNKYWDETRLVSTVGEDKELETWYYSGADLEGATDMVVTCALGMKPSTVAYQRKVMEAAGKGLLGNIADPAIRGRLLEELDIEGFDMEYVADARKARRVLRALRDGKEAPAILPTDGHQIQYQIMRAFSLTTEFEQLPDEAKQAIIARAQQHQQAAAQAQQATMMAAQAAKGTSPEATQAVVDSGAMGQEVPTQGVGG